MKLMLIRFLFNGRNLSCSVTHQARSFAQKSTHNNVTQYFIRAKLIDSIRLCFRSGSISSILPLLENLNFDSFVVTNVLRSAPSPEHALEFVDVLKRVPGFAHTQHTLHAIAKVLAKSGRVAQLRKLIEAINDGKFQKVPPISYLERLRLFAVAGDIDSVTCVWDEVKVHGVKPCVECYNVVIGVYAKTGEDLKAVCVFRDMLHGGSFPNSRTFTIVMDHLLNSCKVDEAKVVFDMLPQMRIKHTIMQYSLMVRAFLDVERYDDVTRILREMKVEGVLPPRSMLSSLKQIQEVVFFEEIDEFIREMLPDDRIKKIEYHSDDEDEANDDHHDLDAETDAVQLKPWLDPRALASALRHWEHEDVTVLENANIVWTGRLVCKIVRNIKSPQTAWSFFCWVARQPGFIHDVHTYTVVIKKLISRKKVDLVDRVLLKVKNEGIKLGFNTVKTIIDFHGLSREGDAALRVFHDVELLTGQLSKSEMLVLFSSLLRTLVKCGRDCDILDMIDKMYSLGMHPDVQTFSGLMHHFATKGDFKAVQKLFGMHKQSGMEPDTYMYRTLIHTYCKSKKATLALRLLEEIRSSDLNPDGATKKLLVKSLWKEGRLREAAIFEQTCTEVDDSLPVPSPSNLFNVSSADLKKVYNIYYDSFQVSDMSVASCENSVS